MYFLKFPITMVRTLLEEWADYMKSPEYAKEKVRAQRLEPRNQTAMREQEDQLRLQEKVHSLRHQILQMKDLHAKKWYNEMSEQEKQQYTKWWSGQMDQELESLTLEFHGKRKSSTPYGSPVKCGPRIRLR